MKNSIKNKKWVLNLVIILAWAFLPQISYASNVINGNSNLSNNKFQSLIVNGSLDFNGLIIDDDLHVNGSTNGKNLKCQKFKINGSFNGKNIEAIEGSISGSVSGNAISIQKNLEVSGSLNATNITVPGETKISGSMSVVDGNFGNIELASDKSDLTNSKAVNILVRKGKDTIQKLELNGKTIISGDVTFESGNGEIYLSEGSQINGSIKGASIIKK